LTLLHAKEEGEPAACKRGGGALDLFEPVGSLTRARERGSEGAREPGSQGGRAGERAGRRKGRRDRGREGRDRGRERRVREVG